MKTEKKIKPLPFPVYFWTVVTIAMAGLADAVYLAISHYRVYTDMGYKSFCAVSKSINCDTVSQSPFSIFLNVPVPIWGIVGYLLFLALLYPAREGPSNNNRFWPTLFVIVLVFSICSIILSIISVAFIHSYCIMCMVSHAVNLMLMFFTWLIHKRFANISIASGIYKDIQWIRGHIKESGIFLGMAAGMILLLMLFTPHYWEMSGFPLGRELSRGTTEDGHPWIGAMNPRLVISEFTDYQCFQCKKMHFFLREFMASHPGTIRLIHRNFPMDHIYNPMVKEPYHIGSGKMALLSLYANKHDKFWEISDFLFNTDMQKGHFNIREMAKAAGFDVIEFASSVNDRTLQQKLRADIREGIRLGITGTPGYLIDGKVYVGYIPADIINAVME
jgi:uncharacterized membrane protein